MARVFQEKRKTPGDDDEAEHMQNEAAEVSQICPTALTGQRVRVKKERLDIPGPSRLAAAETQDDREESQMEQSSDEEELGSQNEDDEDEDMLESLDDVEAMRLYEAAQARKPKYAGVRQGNKGFC